MRKIIFLILMGCTACLAQTADQFIIGQWYLADGCVPKAMGAWATYPTGSTKFCFSKTKPAQPLKLSKLVKTKGARSFFAQKASWSRHGPKT